MSFMNFVPFIALVTAGIPQDQGQLQDAIASDPVGATLKASGIIHTDIGKFYKIKYDYTDIKRSQSTYIRKDVYSYNELAGQECFSQIYESKSPPEPSVIKTMFQKTFSLGGLILEPPSPNQEFWRIRFRYEIPTHSTPERVKAIVQIISITADKLERELGSEDKL